MPLPYTRLSLDGYGARRAGSFAGKDYALLAVTPTRDPRFDVRAKARTFDLRAPGRVFSFKS